MNTPVSFPIAKLLAEKGFDEVSQKWYSVEGSLYSQVVFNNNRGFVPAYKCEAPTIADVVMWLYEKHGIWITICVIGENGFGYWLHNKDRKRLNPEDQGGYWYSPTEAYEAGIEHTLNHII